MSFITLAGNFTYFFRLISITKFNLSGMFIFLNPLFLHLFVHLLGSLKYLAGRAPFLTVKIVILIMPCNFPFLLKKTFSVNLETDHRDLILKLSFLILVKL